jgi:hypothetical protein
MTAFRTIELVLILMLSVAGMPHAQNASPGPGPGDARAAFERLKTLGGLWDASSTQGWQGAHEMRVLAGGTALLSTSRIDPHAGQDEGMATVFHMDADRLMLTHYCMAKNQPRLVATRIREDGQEIEFEFFDGTNMASPAVGHMHRAIFRIQSADKYESRWTFFRNGKEMWMETIVHTRRSDEHAKRR